MYNDHIPHRHKINVTGKTVCSIYKDTDNKLIKLNYIESRQIYCFYYEQAVCKNPDFLKLKQMLEEGYSLAICGYDGYDVHTTLEESYLNPSKCFGHELVLYCMLKNEYPWHKYKTLDL